MKKCFFIAFTAIALLFASCTKEAVIPTQFAQTEAQTIDTRTNSTVEVGCEVASIEIIIEEIIVQFQNFDNDISEMILENNQTVELLNLTTNATELITFDVLSSEIISEDLVVHFETPSINLGNYEISEQQSLDFQE